MATVVASVLSARGASHPAAAASDRAQVGAWPLVCGQWAAGIPSATPWTPRRAGTSRGSIKGRAPWGARAASRQTVLAMAADTSEEFLEMCKQIDDNLSNRPLDLDPSGYFIIRVDKAAGMIVAEHFLNSINEDGVACDPITGEPIPCDGSYKPQPKARYEGRTAKDVSVKILESEEARDLPACTMLVHANYLGRELQKAEHSLLHGGQYWQD